MAMSTVVVSNCTPKLVIESYEVLNNPTQMGYGDKDTLDCAIYCFGGLQVRLTVVGQVAKNFEMKGPYTLNLFFETFNKEYTSAQIENVVIESSLSINHSFSEIEFPVQEKFKQNYLINSNRNGYLAAFYLDELFSFNYAQNEEITVIIKFTVSVGDSKTKKQFIYKCFPKKIIEKQGWV